MSNALAPPLRSAMKQSSRPSSPVASPQLGRVPLPPAPSTAIPAPPAAAAAPSPEHAFHPLPASNAQPPPAHSSIHHPEHEKESHHTSSHPHHPTYTPKVSFDTFENPAASMFSFTLRAQTDLYRRTRNTRVFLCAASPDESGSEALDWAIDTLVQDGDELIVFRGVDEDELAEKDHDLIRDSARELLASIQAHAHASAPDRQLSLILEYVAGKITDSIDRLIALYRPDSLVVGTRGRRFGVGLVQGLGAGLGLGVGAGGIGSVSKYCLSHSPVPVIVVRPGRKLRKAVEKRRADPKRGRHFDS
ncbi:Universal stress protein A family protein C25B2.10 [Psilocybe cubensis]|uniref:Universal stress protein A family protein C25B2.10 n=2 Tax=Psilocybe cubensis TaxID=181762 RepID=A0ACB8HGR3_PSICU|nr:Universal stress protein A family protein C25B2.10 [Psilocybe cubensis]KAH9487210.1 Universal stress protein A family protein C25B2.10 [Psilocybe cubensis]